MQRIFLGVILLLLFVPTVFAAEEDSAEESKSTVQKVGGLLFDVDEGVKVEQGPGGSVYLRSNKEYMNEKLTEIDTRLEDIEKRLKNLERSEEADETVKLFASGKS